MADNDGNMKIIGEFGRRKHEKRVSDCKASVTMYCSGSAGGNNGTTMFVMAGERVTTGYTADFFGFLTEQSQALQFKCPRKVS